MSRNNIESRVATLGVSKTADHLLTANTLDAEVERFFQDHHQELDWHQLLAWLSLPPPNDQKRSVSSPVDRMVERLGATDNVLALLQLEERLETVHDEEVRDEIIAALRPCVGPERWYGLSLLASGGPVYNAVRDVERAIRSNEVTPPMALLQPGPLPSLVATLFDDRRHDDRCKALLVQAAREDDVGGYFLWLLRETKLINQVGSLDDVLGDVPTFHEVDLCGHVDLRWRIDLVRHWPDESERNRWFVQRALNAVERGVPWAHLWWELPPDLRDAAALASRNTDNPAPWIIISITRSLPPREAWQAIFEMADVQVPAATEQEINDSLRLATVVLDRKPTSKEKSDAIVAVQAWDRDAWIFNTPLPDDADDDFDKRFIELAGRFDVGRRPVVDRLLTLPLTQSRATRIVQLAAADGCLWMLDRRAEVIEAAGVLESFRIPLPYPLTKENLDLFNAVAGKQEAGDQLADWFDDLLRRGGHLELLRAVALADLEPRLVSDERRSRLRELASALPISEQARLAASSPWLLSEQDVIDQAEDPAGVRWGAIESLPSYLAPKMKVAASTGAASRVAELLLDRLETLGHSRRDVLGVALRRLKTADSDAVSPLWLATKLDSKSLWLEPGGELLALLLREGDPSGAEVVLQVCVETARLDGKLTYAMHHALAVVCVDIAEQALDGKDAGCARRALTALAHLNAASRLRGRIQALRRFDPPHDVGNLIDVTAELFRRSGKNDPAPVDFIADALGALVSVEGSAS